MTNASGPIVLWIGDASRSESVVARAALEGCLVMEAHDVRAAIGLLEAQERSPEVIVVAQSRPGAVSQYEIERLRREAPLARIVGLLGSWCEGEARSGRPWPGVERVYWHQWPGWVQRELGGSSTLPQTATMEERLLAGAGLPSSYEGWTGVIAICSQRRELAELWIDALRACGATAVAFDGPPEQVSGITAAIWEADGCDHAQAAEIRRLATAVRPAPVVAVLVFPRLEEHQRAMAAGAVAVLSKPLMLPDLWASLPRAAVH